MTWAENNICNILLPIVLDTKVLRTEEKQVFAIIPFIRNEKMYVFTKAWMQPPNPCSLSKSVEK